MYGEGRGAVIKQFVNRTVCKINNNQNEAKPKSISSSFCCSNIKTASALMHLCIFKRTISMLTLWKRIISIPNRVQIQAEKDFCIRGNSIKTWKTKQNPNKNPTHPICWRLSLALSLSLYFCLSVNARLLLLFMQCVVVIAVLVVLVVVVGDDNCAGNRRHNNSATPFSFF